MTARLSARITKLALASTLMAGQLALGQTYERDRSVFTYGKQIGQIRGASGELHQTTPLAASGEFVNQDLEKLTSDESPCILVASATSSTLGIPSNAAYQVFVECFDLVAPKERKSLLYVTDDKGKPLQWKSSSMRTFEESDPGFDREAWNWISARVTPKLAEKIVQEQQGLSAAGPGSEDDPLDHASEIVRGNGITPPALIHSVDAEFSPAGRGYGIQGTCVLRAIVDTDGVPKRIHVTTPLGYGMDEEAIKSLRQFRFKAAQREGKTIPVWIRIETRFHTHGN